jgi:K+-transporting ATPase ATPase A chain
VPLWLIQLGEVIFGGVGSGLYGMLIFAVLAVFIAGLMIGRTPEYLGKKIEAHEIKMAAVAILATPLLVLVGTAMCGDDSMRAAPASPTRRARLSEILYAFSSAGNNNGSAFAGLSANTPFYNTLLGFAMLVRALLDHRAGTGHRRARWQPRSGSRDPVPARCRRTARCSSFC